MGNQEWDQAIPLVKPKSKYDVIIIGGGGHGLATAYYLAKECGITNVAVLEKGYIGGGNTGRNTTIIRSNYLRDEASSLYEHSMRLWEGLSEDLNFNVMFSQRGVYNLGHTLQDMRDIERRVNANVLNGVDAVVGVGGGESTTAPILAVTGNDAIVDWVFIELRDKTAAGTVVATRAALLQRDGDIVSPSDGISPIAFSNNIPGNYFISIRHRNHLGVMSKNKIFLSSTLFLDGF